MSARQSLKKLLVEVPFGALDGLLRALGIKATLFRADFQYYPEVRHWEKNAFILKFIDEMSVQHDRLDSQLNEFLKHKDRFSEIAANEAARPSSHEPHWDNRTFEGLDAISLYGLLAQHNPKRYIEIGSGQSTKFAAKAIRDMNLRTSIISIDPQPRAEIDDICDEVIRQRCETLDTAFSQSLTPDDILFVDNSHRAFQNSDVTIFFTEILPSIPDGMIFGLHDINLPQDYDEEVGRRLYNEQYLLMAYLICRGNFADVLLPNAYISRTPALLETLAPIWQCPNLQDMARYGGAFWMRRGGWE